jgi:predicted restriction endonuclease
MLTFGIRTQLEKAAVDSGFSQAQPDIGAWMIFRAHAMPARLALTHDGDGFAVGTDHSGVATHLAEKFPSAHAPDGFRAFRVADVTAVFRLVQRIWTLAKTLPNEPLHEFERQMKQEVGPTEVLRIRRERIGQDVFRAALMDYWGGACAVTGVTHARLLRASHVIPWAECKSDAERLNVHNGLLLAAHLDAAFDAGLISFQDNGQILISDTLNPGDLAAMAITADMKLSQVMPELSKRLAWHRARYF